MRYRQSCSACVGKSATAYHDVERHERDLNRHRAAERLALVRAANPRGESGHNDPEVYRGEAEHHAQEARKAERLLARSRARVLASFSIGGCVLCGGTGYLIAPGTFVQGAKRAVES